MAIIYSYPSKPDPSLSDQVLITDSESEDPSNATRNATLASIKTAIDVVDKITDINGNNGQTGDIKFSGSNTIDIDFNAGVNSITFDTINLISGSGTAGTIPKWGADGSSLVDSVIKDQGGEDIIIPRFIKHDGDLTNVFGFSNAREFIVSVGPSTADQFLVSQNAIIMKTDSGTKVAAGPSGVTLYSDTSDTVTTTSVARFATTTTGAIVYGQTIAQGAASERGGIIRYYNNTNDRYVGIAGPITQGVNYQIRLPDTIGTVGQVLAIGSISGSNAIMQWVDNSGGGRTCNLTITSTVTNETIANANDGTASIAIANGIANYAAILTHTDSSTKTQTATTSPIVFTGLKPGTWTISGQDNEPSGTTKCPLSGTLSISAASCAAIGVAVQVTDATAPNYNNGRAVVTISGASISPYAMNVKSADGGVDVSITGASPINFTGLTAATYTLSGKDNSGTAGESCDVTGTTFVLGGAAPTTTLTQIAQGSGYTLETVYTATPTDGTGSGLLFTVATTTGGGPVVTADGSGYVDAESATGNETGGGEAPTTLSTYQVNTT